MSKDRNYYVTGKPFLRKDGEYEFQLIKPTYSELPYISDTQKCSAMQITGSYGCALYLVNFKDKKLEKLKDKHYEKNLVEPPIEAQCPDIVELSEDMESKLIKAVDTWDTFLPF